MNSSVFVCLGKYLPHFWRTAFTGIIFLVGRFFFFLSELWIYHSQSFSACKVSTERSANSLMRIRLNVTSFSCCFKILSLYFTFDNLIIVYVNEDLFRFHLFGSFRLHESICPFPSPDLGSFQPLFL